MADTPNGQVTTATSGVENTYYGLPVIRAPNWHWLVVHYFFLGSLAGGGFVLSVIADLLGKDRAIVRAARYLSAVAILPCPALLALDLGRPDRALHMLRIVKLRSPLNLGSWALLAMGGFSTLSGALQLASDVLGREILAVPRRVLGIAGLPFSYFLSGYTGLLLAVTNVPLWAKFWPFMGPSFMCGAFSNSLAAISLILQAGGEEQPETVRDLARAEVACLATEATLLTAGLVKTGKLSKPLTASRWAFVFWPATYFGGILIPMALHLTGPARSKETSPRRRMLTSIMVLIGGYCLRASMVFAGHKSAERPEDYFEYTKMGNG